MTRIRCILHPQPQDLFAAFRRRLHSALKERQPRKPPKVLSLESMDEWLLKEECLVQQPLPEPLRKYYQGRAYSRAVCDRGVANWASIGAMRKSATLPSPCGSVVDRVPVERLLTMLPATLRSKKQQIPTLLPAKNEISEYEIRRGDKD